MGINNKKRLDFKSGFTLIELILTLAILGIVLIMAYSMGNFGSISFNNGLTKSDIQSNIRIASDYITKELRYSSNAMILPTFPPSPDSTRNYIYVDGDGILKQYYDGDKINILGNTSNNMATTLQFKIENSKTVQFNIQESYKNQTFQLASSALLLNIGDQSLLNGTGAVISYKTDPIISNINASPVRTINITAPSNAIGINGGTLQLTSNVTPSDASIKTVTWAVNDTTLATIDTNGLLKTSTTVTAGKNIVVTATAQDGSGVSLTYAVTTANLTMAKVTSFAITSNYDCIFYGGPTLKMLVSAVTPVNATDQTVTWSIDKDSSVATIDQSTGIITAKTNSNLIIVVTAKTMDGSNLTKTKNITINPKLTSIYITGGSTITRKTSMKLSCYANPGENLATASIGVSKLIWSVTGSTSASISTNGLLTIGNDWGITLIVKAIATLNDGTNITTTKNITVQK